MKTVKRVSRNLYKQRSGKAASSWLFRYRINGREHAMGLGPTDIVPLREARKKVRELRAQVYGGVDPLENK